MNVHRRTPVTSETIRLWSEYVGAAPTMALILHCGMEKRLSRESHNLKNGGSNPPPATYRETAVPVHEVQQDRHLIRHDIC